MDARRELRSGLRLLIMALVFLAMSCESDGDGGDCLGSTDSLITGCSDGCGAGLKPIGDGCIGSMIFGGDGDGCGTCAGDGCVDMGSCIGDSCGGCGDCGDAEHYVYNGEHVERSIQLQVTDSLFTFINENLMEIIKVAAGDSLPIDGNVMAVCIPRGTDAQVMTLCTRPDNSGPCAGSGCKLDLVIGSIEIVPRAPDGIAVRVRGVKANGNITTSYSGCNMAEIRTGGGGISVDVGMRFRLNNSFPNNSNGLPHTELYVGGNEFSLGGLNNVDLKTACHGCNFWENAGCFLGGWTADAIASVATGLAGSLIEGAIGAMTCRGCNTNADCGPGATCGNGKVCTYPNKPFGQVCQGIMIGADARLDAGALLGSIDPGAEGLFGLRAYLGNSVNAAPGRGITFAGRIGAVAPEPSPCVPVRPSPIVKGKQSCRDGEICPALAELNGGGIIKNPATDLDEAFHIGVGVGQGALNHVLWSAYTSGALCLSVGGETAGLEMLSTNLVSAFVSSLSSLTYGVDQAIMLQIRPQQPPVVDFQKDKGQGAQLLVKLPELEIDFYTVVDNRYARIFTLGADIELPLGVKGSNATVEVAIGDLANVIDPASVRVSNVEMVSKAQVESLVNNIPTLIGALTGVLGDDLIPPIEIPEMSGIAISFVGPGLVVLDEGGTPGALGLFLNMAINPDEMGGLFPNMEPRIANLDIEVRDPNELRADLAARRRADVSFSYTDLMPRVVATMDVAGADLAASDVEFAYSINNGPWSFWQRGPVLTIDNPILAMESKFDVRITARAAGNVSSGSDKVATFSFVNDYSAPSIEISADGSRVNVVAVDKVYNQDELIMQYRLNGGAWSTPGAIENLDILPQLLEGQVVVDVLVADPSGNSRTVRRTFGAAEKASTSAAASNSAGAEGGCSTTQGNGGLLAILALLGLVVARRRESSSAVAASPGYISLAILTILMLSMMSVGCGNKKKSGAVCDPVCDSASQCEAGVCMPMACDSDEDCALKDRCIDGFCKANMACESSDDCEHGHICKDGTCTPSECSDHPDCSALSCPDGKLPYCDYDDYQSVEAGECVCESGAEMGRHGGWLNVVAFDEDESVVALAYSEQYGDVILGDLQDDGLFKWTFIDGVPDGPVDRPPTGVRNGIIAVGDDAGRYLSVAVETLADGGAVLHTAYQYRVSGQSNSKLRYARGVRNGSAWSWTQIDVDDLDVNGNFPSVFLTRTDAVLDGDGAEVSPAGGGVGIFYMVRDIAYIDDVGAPAEHYTEFWAAYAPTLTPMDASDFELREIAQAENTIPCGGLCESKALCATDLNLCVARGSGCDACAEGETCVKVDGGSACMKTTDPTTGGLSAIPRGIGLFSSSVVDDAGVVHTAFYDQVHGNLNYAQISVADGTPTTVFGPLIVDGEIAGRSTGDVGRWTRIHALDPGRVVIFYEDAGRAELRAAVVQGNNVKITVLDDGNYSDLDSTKVQSNRVGASIFSRAIETGGFEVYYQDATNAVVRRVVWTDMNQAPQGHAYSVFGSAAGLARELTGTSQALDPADIALANGEGALGFFVNVVESGGRTLFASKHVMSPTGGSRSVEMNVRTGSIVHPVVDDGGDDEGATP